MKSPGNFRRRVRPYFGTSGKLSFFGLKKALVPRKKFGCRKFPAFLAADRSQSWGGRCGDGREDVGRGEWEHVEWDVVLLGRGRYASDLPPALTCPRLSSSLKRKSS